MPAQLIGCLTRLLPALLVGVLGYLTRKNGPQGYVNGLGDWSQVAPALRDRAKRVVSNALYGLALLIGAHGVYVYRYAGDAHHRQLATACMVVGIAIVIVGLKIHLARLRRAGGDVGSHGGR